MNLGRAFWERAQKSAPVRFAKDSAIENDDGAGVRLCTNEPPNSLAQFENGFRK